MATNIEIKAGVVDFEGLRSRVETLCGSAGELVPQEDTFFNTTEGRLKLRITPAPEGESRRGQLIHYWRLDAAGPKRSEYFIFETDEPEILKQVLSGALGIRGVVRKKRWLYWAGNTRIHLDQVEGLGSFLELEVVMGPDQPIEEGEDTAETLMRTLGVNQTMLIEGAYIDLLENQAGQ